MPKKKSKPAYASSLLEAEVLGMGDAIWTPMRSWEAPGPSNVWTARHDFPKRGARPPVGRGPAGRMAMMRRLAELEEAGRLSIFRSPGALLGVLLSAAAEAEVRAACGLPSLEQSVAALRYLASLSRRDPVLITDAWIAETRLAGVEWGLDQPTKPLIRLEELLLPVLAAGLAVSKSDGEGRTYYAISSAGWSYLDANPTSEVVAMPEPSPDRWDPEWEVYIDAHQSATHRLRTMAPSDPGNIGELALPASIARLPIGGYRLAAAKSEKAT